MTLSFSCEVVHEKLWKSVNICKSYSKKNQWYLFFWTWCINAAATDTRLHHSARPRSTDSPTKTGTDVTYGRDEKRANILIIKTLLLTNIIEYNARAPDETFSTLNCCTWRLVHRGWYTTPVSTLSDFRFFWYTRIVIGHFRYVWYTVFTFGTPAAFGTLRIRVLVHWWYFCTFYIVQVIAQSTARCRPDTKQYWTVNIEIISISVFEKQTSIILEYYLQFRFRPYRRSRQIILLQSA